MKYRSQNSLENIKNLLNQQQIHSGSSTVPHKNKPRILKEGFINIFHLGEAHLYFTTIVLLFNICKDFNISVLVCGLHSRT